VQADGVENSGQFWLRDEQVTANNLAPRTKHVVLGDYQRWGPVVAFEKNPGTYGGGTLAGEHTKQILGELGFDAEQITKLEEQKVVWVDQTALDLAATLAGAR
jgi:crotonobetainyl-CoA:carnitine CoA-transferase CaiB-like acyl-CoA transferase